MPATNSYTVPRRESTRAPREAAAVEVEPAAVLVAVVAVEKVVELETEVVLE